MRSPTRSGITVHEIDLGDGRFVEMIDREGFDVERLRGLQSALRDWLIEPLSYENRSYRLDALAKAFGLARRLFEEAAEGGVFRGGFHLLQDIVLWTEENADAGLNSPAGPDHPLRDIEMD